MSAGHSRTNHGVFSVLFQRDLVRPDKPFLSPSIHATFQRLPTFVDGTSYGDLRTPRSIRLLQKHYLLQGLHLCAPPSSNRVSASIYNDSWRHQAEKFSNSVGKRTDDVSWDHKTPRSVFDWAQVRVSCDCMLPCINNDISNEDLRFIYGH